MSGLNEIFFFNPIFNFTVKEVADQMALIPDDEDITLLLNSPGGDVTAGFTLMSLLAERKGKVNIRVLGQAASMAALLPLQAAQTTALDTSDFMIHKAAFGPFFEPSDSDLQMLDKKNKDLHDQLKAKIDDNKLKEFTGKRLRNIFGEGERIDVWLTAKQAKAVGLIDKIEKLTPAVAAEFSQATIMTHQQSVIAAINKNQIPQSQEPEETPIENPTKKAKNMDINTLRTQHPELYNQVFDLGVAAEKDRAGAWLKFAGVDLKAVTDGIESGKPMGQTEMADFSQKMFAGMVKEEIKDDSAEPIQTPEAPTPGDDAENAEVSAFQKELDELRKSRKAPESKSAAELGITIANGSPETVNQ